VTTIPKAAPSSFDEAWQRAEGLPGWCTRSQAEALYLAVNALRDGGTVVEIGSHQGRSTVVLAHAARKVGARVVAIDPFVEGKMFGGRSTRQKFETHVAAAGLSDLVDLRPDYSRAVRDQWTDGDVDVLYIDGKHDYWTVVDDLRWGRHVVPGGEVLIHDAFSSLGVTLGMVRTVALGGEWTYLGRIGSLARVRHAAPTGASRVRFAKELPWFGRNLVIKLLLRLRLRPLTRIFGHEASHDPY
jgi:predicted O-methyltransferase YrrM